MSQTNGTLTLSDDKLIKSPLKFLLTAGAVVAVSATAWAYHTFQLNATTGRVDKVEVEQKEIVKELRAQRDMLIEVRGDLKTLVKRSQ